jgi:hypothetical protein
MPRRFITVWHDILATIPTNDPNRGRLKNSVEHQLQPEKMVYVAPEAWPFYQWIVLRNALQMLYAPPHLLAPTLAAIFDNRVNDDNDEGIDVTCRDDGAIYLA